MKLPFDPPLEPMLAKPSDGLPAGDDWLFEPKWDGFRAIVFRDGDEVFTQSRDLKPLDRYFPELAEPLKAALPERCVVDGEVVIAGDGALQFEALLLRIHPAESRVRMLAAESPASFVAWDLLALGDATCGRRHRASGASCLEEALGGVAARRPSTSRRRRPTGRSPRTGSTGSRARASTASSRSGSAIRTSRASGRCSRSSTSGRPTASSPASAGTRTARALTSDRCCSGCTTTTATSTTSGSRRRSRGIGGRRSSRSWSRSGRTRSRATRGGEWAEWAVVGSADASGQRLPGATSRWNRGKDLSWEPLRAERVVEVAYDHLQGDRFRHGTTFKRWRPDKSPADCRYDQLEETAPYLIEEIFGS